MAVFNADEVAELVREARTSGKSVGLCHGCFDIVHIGHIRHFTAARMQCDLLFVSVTADRFVNKGPDRPIIPQDERVEVIGSLKPVAGAMINQFPTAIEVLRLVRPSMYFKGQEYQHSTDPRFLEEKAAAESLGVEVRHTFERVHSSSKIVHAIRKPTQSEVEARLRDS